MAKLMFKWAYFNLLLKGRLAGPAESYDGREGQTLDPSGRRSENRASPVFAFRFFKSILLFEILLRPAPISLSNKTHYRLWWYGMQEASSRPPQPAGLIRTL